MRLQLITQMGRFTLFDVAGLVGLLAGGFIGAKYGYSQAGTVGGVIGACVTGAVFCFLAFIPYLISANLLRRSLEKEISQRLRERIHGGKEYYIVHLLLAQLMKRDESINGEFSAVIDLLISESVDRRRFGWMALKMAFPEAAINIDGYDPADPVEKCRSLVSKIDLHGTHEAGGG